MWFPFPATHSTRPILLSPSSGSTTCHTHVSLSLSFQGPYPCTQLSPHSCSLDIPPTNTLRRYCSLNLSVLLFQILKKPTQNKMKSPGFLALRIPQGRMTRPLPTSCHTQMTTCLRHTISQYSGPLTPSFWDSQIHTLSKYTPALSFLIKVSL